MLHGPATPTGHDPAASFKARLGIWMFAFYSLFYAGFVGINLYKPLWMEMQVLLGMNLATVYGFALIVVALAQAIVYNAICRKRERALAVGPQKGAAK
jgi:uncharacterized membrane protein (DUF485 family)